MAIDAATKYVLVVLLFFTYTYCVNGFPQFSIDPENPFNAGLNVLGHTRLRALEKISKTMIKESIKPTWHILCIACKFSAKSLQYLIRFGVKEDTLAFVASSFCKKFHVYSDRVCDGLGQMYKVIV